MRDKLLKIINHYGVVPQLKYFQSEVFELNEAIIQFQTIKAYDKNHYEDEFDKKMLEHIAEELADVMVMLNQFQFYYKINRTDIRKIMNEKIERQLKRIENEKNG